MYSRLCIKRDEKKEKRGEEERKYLWKAIGANMTVTHHK
jgi:hypothetical protein